jgi:PPOX class probable F420-dependent enzyme
MASSCPASAVRTTGQGGDVTETQDGSALHPRTIELARGRNFAAMSTTMSDGSVQTQYVWVDTDGRRLVVNTEVHRAKYRNVERDPRVTLAIRDEADPYRFVEVRGRLVESVRGEAAERHNSELSRKYWGTEFPNPTTSERVILFIEAQRQIVYG